MMRILIALVLYALMWPAQAIGWAGLWRNPDQQGEALLQRGDAAAAAKVYTDRRRKAYAEFRAGDYAGAARDLADFDDSDANYNRGNALAHAGDLQGAIGAYDAALKHDPHNRDAAHNRELVQNALKQQSPQQQDSNSGESKQGKPGGQNSNDQGSNDQGSNSQSSSGQDQRREGNQSGQSGGQQGNGLSSQGKPQQQSASSSQPGSSQSGQQGGQQGQGANNSQQQSAANSQDTATQGDKGASGKGASANGASNAEAVQPGEQQHTYAQGRDDAEQARRDAAAGLGQANPDKRDGQGKQNGNGNQAGSIGAGQSMPPESEQQLAQDQWLRSIPDDPGGLLRRKFMIEYMMRQQKVSP